MKKKSIKYATRVKKAAKHKNDASEAIKEIISED